MKIEGTQSPISPPPAVLRIGGLKFPGCGIIFTTNPQIATGKDHEEGDLRDLREVLAGAKVFDAKPVLTYFF